jgi:hypothetical protein
MMSGIVPSDTAQPARLDPRTRRTWNDDEGAQNRKGRSLGERPAFLGSPPGCGMSKPWGVWEGGFDEAAWGAAGGLSKFSATAPEYWSAPNSRNQTSPNRKQVKARSPMTKTLTNRFPHRHLQNCISHFCQGLLIPYEFSSARHTVNKKGHTECVASANFFHFCNYFQYLSGFHPFQATCFECKLLCHLGRWPFRRQRATVPSSSVPC